MYSLAACITVLPLSRRKLVVGGSRVEDEGVTEWSRLDAVIRGFLMCKLEDDLALAERVMNRVGADENARALVRLLSYAADEAAVLRADLAHSLIRASIEALNLEIAGSVQATQASLRLT
jgi:hypothetical protein